MQYISYLMLMVAYIVVSHAGVARVAFWHTVNEVQGCTWLYWRTLSFVFRSAIPTSLER